VTTPHGTDVMPISSVAAQPGLPGRGLTRIQLTSVEPPPMSISRAKQSEGDRRIEQVLAARQRKPRLFRRLDQVEAEAGAHFHHAEKVLAVAGTAAGLGGDVTGACHSVAFDFGRANAKRMQRAFYGFTAQRTAQRHPLAQPYGARIGIDHLKTLDRCLCHQEPAIVGAEINGSEGVRKSTAVPATLGRGFPGHSQPFPWRDGI
jgi:hypothetical protein